MRRIKSAPVRTALRRLWRLSRHSLVIFALALIAAIWFLALHLIKAEREAAERETVQDAVNIATVLEQNVARSISEIDRVVQFLRLSYERADADADWQALVRDGYTVNDQTLQIAVINARGYLVATSIGVVPSSPLDLSDREHFRVHRDRNEDRLFISKPVLGRHSGKWSVQITRRYSTIDGAFGGVIVASLDPSYLSRAYLGLKLGGETGLAIVGNDDIVRSGTGRYKDALAKPLPTGETRRLARTGAGNTLVHYEEDGDDTRLVTRRVVADLPLAVIVTSPSYESNSAWLRSRRNTLIGALVMTIIAFAAMAGSLWSRRRHELQMLHLARHDPLTHLANRTLFREKLDNAFGYVGEGRGFALHLVDLDRFKFVNDTYGHPQGDRLLRAVADRLRLNLRSCDVVARFGGDEFAVLQAGVAHPDDAQGVADRLCHCLSEPYELDGLRLEIGASIGIAVASRDANNGVDLLKCADLALYAAKSEGRRTWRAYGEEMNATVLARRALESSLRSAVEKDQLELHYQPINAIDTGAVTGYEALLRWRHPERGLVPPMEFIPLAEETGLIIQIGIWVLRRACEDMAKRPHHLKVAVNFSPVQFRTPDLAATVRRVLDDSGLSPSRLEIEITESTLMQKDDLTIRQLEELRALGIKIAMDDFGTGYSSLAYLQSYPINCIKIDRSFVMTLGQSNSAAAIIRAITTLATCIGMSTIAEGVETRQQLEELGQLGCTEAQGYYFSPPRPAAEILPGVITGHDGGAQAEASAEECGGSRSALAA